MFYDRFGSVCELCFGDGLCGVMKVLCMRELCEYNVLFLAFQRSCDGYGVGLWFVGGEVV